jgi:hypothetical protein
VLSDCSIGPDRLTGSSPVCPYFCFCPSQTLTYHRYNSLCICASRIVPSTATRKADPQRWGLTRGSRYFESTKWLSDSEVPDCATPPRVPALGNILKVGTATPESNVMCSAGRSGLRPYYWPPRNSAHSSHCRGRYGLTSKSPIPRPVSSLHLSFHTPETQANINSTKSRSGYGER